MPTDRKPNARVRDRHFGNDQYAGHTGNSDFDFYCVAHDSDYAPKYLQGEVCHDGWGEGYCHPNCNRCPVPCPITPCPFDD